MDLITLALASTLTCQPVLNKKLIGFWESASTSKGGIGNNIEFGEDGSYIAALTVIIDLNYAVKDGKIYNSKKPGEPVSYETGAEIIVGDDSLVLIGENDKKEVRNRIGARVDDSVVGKYKYRHYSGGMAYEQFTADGAMHFRMPMQSIHGCYSIEGDEIKVIIQDQEPKNLHYELRAESLFIEGSKGPSEYTHVKEGAWYESGYIDHKKPDKQTPQTNRP